MHPMSENIAEITACATLRGRGLALMSGGLDSTLSVCVLRAQGLHMEGVVFESPFFGSVRARKAAEKAQMAVRDNFSHMAVEQMFQKRDGDLAPEMPLPKK